MKILLVVRSFRDGNLVLCIGCLKHVAKLCFSLDHTNQPGDIQDLEILNVEDKIFFEKLRKHLSVYATCAPSFGIAYDHKYGQNNRCTKATSGYINLVNTEQEGYFILEET